MKLKTGVLYLMSGIPGCGKGKILSRSIDNSNVTEEMIVSSDKIRTNVVGKLFSFRGDKIHSRIHEGDSAIFEILEKVVSEKLKEKLTVFIDSTNISDKERSVFVNLAAKYGVETHIIIVNTPFEECIKNDREREVSVGFNVCEKFGERFQSNSKFPYTVVSNEEIIELIPNAKIEEEALDIIGDIHGLYNEFILLIRKLGYSIENGIPTHPEGRKLLFLGDFIDRGPDSLKMFRLVRDSVLSGKHYSVSGNHEVKLLRNLQSDPKNIRGSFAVISTYLNFIQNMKQKEIEKSIDFLKRLPGYYIYKDIVFAHANIGFFDFRKTPFSELVYGNSKDDVDSDKEYQELYDRGINTYTLFRGHVFQISPQDNVFSLEMGGCFEGPIALLPLDKFINLGEKRKSFEKSLVTLKTDFNFSKVTKNSLLTQFRQLEKEKLVKAHFDESGLLKIYKYSSSVFYNNLWDKGGYPLLKARGIVVDISGKIVQHPFDKVFNYHENGAGEDIPMNEEVQYVQKLNGFLGNIGFNPFTKKILYTTTGSFDSPFVQYIKDFIDRELENKLKKFFAKNKVTLSFEVIHSEDPHIIKYPEHMFGLHLIGIRGLSPKDKNWEETEVDRVAEELGFRRPYHGWKKLGDIIGELRTLKDEGFMIRKRNKEDKTTDIVLKMKSPYYLTSKFIGRMGLGQIKFMFANPETFKSKIGDEEFFPLVDKIVAISSIEEFSNMEKNKRITFVRGIVNSLL